MVATLIHSTNRIVFHLVHTPYHLFLFTSLKLYCIFGMCCVFSVYLFLRVLFCLGEEEALNISKQQFHFFLFAWIFVAFYRQFFVCSTSTQQFRISSHEERTIITYYIVRPTTLFQFEWDVTFSIEIVHSFAMQVHMVLMCFFCNRLLL